MTCTLSTAYAGTSTPWTKPYTASTRRVRTVSGGRGPCFQWWRYASTRRMRCLEERPSSLWRESAQGVCIHTLNHKHKCIFWHYSNGSSFVAKFRRVYMLCIMVRQWVKKAVGLYYQLRGGSWSMMLYTVFTSTYMYMHVCIHVHVALSMQLQFCKLFVCMPKR